MEISATSFLHLLKDISEAISGKEPAIDYDDLLQKIFEKEAPRDMALADFEVQDYPKSEKVFGRDVEAMMLLSELLDQAMIQLSVISIFGGCGSGKTTLARLVYEDDEVEDQFEVRAWVKVDGEELKLHHAAQGILKSAMGMSCSINDLDELDEMVRDVLQSRRCLIVFDGVENMSYHSWEYMNMYWFNVVNMGSKVLITTTRKLDAAYFVPNRSFLCSTLSEDDGWSLFRFLAFGSSKDIKETSISTAKNLAALCRGIPLLLKLVGSLMRYDDEQSNLLSSVDFSYGTLSTLSDESVVIMMCVWALPPHLRQCLAYCSLFPKGYAIDKVKIIRMWIADGIVDPSPRNYSLEDTGAVYFHQLLRRSFFTDITRDEYGNIIDFRMPGLIHKIAQDVARVVLKGKLGVIGSIGEDARQVSLVLPFAGENDPKHLRTLILSPTIHLGGNLHHSLFELNGLQSLDLSCSGIRNLSGEICELKELRYLNLSYTRIERLPDSVADLSELRTLDLSWCYHLKVLPEGMRRLTHMRHLDLTRCESLSYLPSGIEFLTSLNSMPMFILSKDPYSARFGELKMLNELRGRLEIRNLENVRKISEAKDAMLHWKDLHHLGLTWSQNADDCSEVLEHLEPTEGLKVLDLTGYMGFRFPSWMSRIYGLTKISINYCGCVELPPLGQLRFLDELQLKGMKNIGFIGNEFYGDGFDGFFLSLKELGLYDLPRLIDWSDAKTTDVYGHSSQSVFPMLKTLTIEGCPELQSLPPLPTLPNLIVWNSNERILSSLTSFTSLSSLLINDMELAMMSLEDLSMLSSLKKLILVNIKDLEDLELETLCNLNALEHLGILHCHRLRHIWLYGFTSLQKLHVVDCQAMRSVFGPPLNPQLVEWVIEDCPRLSYFRDIPGRTSLRKLILKNIDAFFVKAKDLESLEKLEYLFISGCPALERQLLMQPSVISRIPCVILGNHKIDNKDTKNDRGVSLMERKMRKMKSWFKR